jgi:hypothetical protein
LRVAVERAEVAAAGGQSAATVALLFALAADDAAAARWVDKAFAANDAILNSPMYFFLPEDWAHLPATEAALSRPEGAALYAIRRRNRR